MHASICMCTRENHHVNVSMLSVTASTCVFVTHLVKSQQPVIWSPVSLSSGPSQPLMPLGSRACIKALAHKQEICLVSPERVGVSELRLSLSPCCRDQTPQPWMSMSPALPWPSYCCSMNIHLSVCEWENVVPQRCKAAISVWVSHGEFCFTAIHTSALR